MTYMLGLVISPRSISTKISEGVYVGTRRGKPPHRGSRLEKSEGGGGGLDERSPATTGFSLDNVSSES